MRMEPTWAVHILYQMMVVPREQACTHFHVLFRFFISSHAACTPFEDNSR